MVMVLLAGSFGPARLRILVAESDAVQARQIAAALAAGLLNAEVEIADSLTNAEARLRGVRFSALIAGAGLGEDSVERLRPLISGPLVITGASGLSTGADLTRRGADAVLPVPFSPSMTVESLVEALKARPALPESPQPAISGFAGFIGGSDPMRRVYSEIERVASSKASVFITGESGTGKELAANAVHAQSGRSGPFIALNCGAIPKELIESEVFGHMRGAFTGAVEDHAGAAEAAHGGTLFLDEICEMDIALQTKLLRFVQTGEVRRVGGTKAKKVDVRIVCATNRDPKAEVQAGRFREDLFYRLHVLPVQMPPLRLRGEDTLMLARSFLARLSKEEGRSFIGFDPFSERLIASYAWPGNVRELESVIRRIVVLNPGGLVTADMMPVEITNAVLSQPHGDAKRAKQILPMWVQEGRIIEEALAAFDGNIARAAAALDINPSTIYRRRQSSRKAAAE
ncbi:regulatory protein LuxO [Terrihabitans soli]|uniref:Regulatory protein LuxO n=1 Tax=Terrihabitans soli TaxID=708113 RepID=A0A6S6QYM9_9HYPH|nr:sigma-54 dependent transcriptional regulator [Terrihabitans soli]BCJ91688.1 regulatory protein LuxO [Terrihabitans soli]